MSMLQPDIEKKFLIRQRLFAWMLSLAAPAHDRLVGSRKERLFSGLAGTVLEIGPGTGINFSYYPKAIRWIGLEPNPHLHTYLRREARRLGFAIELHLGNAEEIPLESDSIDFVVSTLVLCSVRDPHATLREVLRVLKPGGSLLFLEHIAGRRGSWLRRAQCAIRPVWQFLADGCCPDRETIEAIRSAGFADLLHEEFKLRLAVLGPHAAGSARKGSLL
jgi:ubiquinone/menaquinone biosynthesis C-methylase UbiE